jgi:hypothetical protein
MKTRAAVILLVLIGTSFASGMQKPKEWIKYDSKDGRYSVMLPSQPTVDTQDSATADGIKFTQYKATAVDGRSVYLVGYFDQLPGTDVSFDRARDKMVEAMNGTVVGESKITLAANPGVELKVTFKDPEGAEYLLRARLFNVDKRIYVLEFLYPKADDSEALHAAGSKYLDSVQLLKN